MPNRFLRQVVVRAFPILAITLWAGAAHAQLYRQEVVVGLTPTCSEGFQACWSEAYNALNDPKLVETLGIVSVTPYPDLYNCTATVRLKDGEFPDPVALGERFREVVGQAVLFRGIEVTVTGTMSREGDGYVVKVPGAPGPLALDALRGKLQYNFGKAAARQPEPDEQAAYERLTAKFEEGERESLEVQITGPLRAKKCERILEVREFFDLSDELPTNEPPRGASSSQRSPE